MSAKLLTRIQNDLFAKWHLRDGDEFAVGEDEIVVEKEGYLHGKKILADPEEELEETEGPKTPTKTEACPFSGVVSGVERLDFADISMAQKA